MEQNNLRTDLLVVPIDKVVGAIDLARSDADLVLVSGMDNLAQALTLCLVTPQGELAHLGHPEYGSRLYNLVGRIMGPEVYALAMAYVRNALRRDNRVSIINQITVGPYPLQQNTLWIQVELQPNLVMESMNLSLSFELNSGFAEVNPIAIG